MWEDCPLLVPELGHDTTHQKHLIVEHVLLPSQLQDDYSTGFAS